MKPKETNTAPITPTEAQKELGTKVRFALPHIGDQLIAESEAQAIQRAMLVEYGNLTQSYKDAVTRAERAEAELADLHTNHQNQVALSVQYLNELATERARLDWLQSRPSTVLCHYAVAGWSIRKDRINSVDELAEHNLHDLRSAIDAAMKEDGK